MRKVFLFVISFLVSYTLYGCGCSSCPDEDHKIPDHIRQKADAFIISKTGKEFFDANIRFLENSKRFESDYDLYYVFRVADRDYIREVISFTLDSLGNINTSREVLGIPDCKSDPSSCVFTIDEGKAIEIAKQADLPKGIKDWKIDFKWSASLVRYVWMLTSTESESGEGDFYKGSGTEMIIHPGTGDVLDTYEWFVR